MLAAAARRSGHEVAIIDRFGDADTRALARSLQVYQDPVPGFCNAARLLTLATGGMNKGLDCIVTGSGFEACPQVLAKLSEHYPVIGNNAATVHAVKQPDIFFPALERLRIPHPETRLDGPPGPGDWLFKPVGGCGGQGVRAATPQDQAGPEGYLQARISGQSYSILFLADGRDALCIGLNETWNRASGYHPYLFAGAVSQDWQTFGPRPRIETYVEALVRQFQLRGLCGLDFMLAGNRIYVLEVNPRPTATLELHDIDGGLFAAHLQASRGVLAYRTVAEVTCRGLRIFYTDRGLTVPGAFDWPCWVRDIPDPGRRLQTGQPCCSLVAEAETPAAVSASLDHRQQTLEGMMFSQTASC